MKTYKEWSDAKVSFTEFAEVGDEVDEEIIDYFIGCLPPVFYSSTIVQCGEPYDHFGKNGQARYMTFKKIDDKWFYVGKWEKGRTI